MSVRTQAFLKAYRGKESHLTCFSHTSFSFGPFAPHKPTCTLLYTQTRNETGLKEYIQEPYITDSIIFYDFLQDSSKRKTHFCAMV